MATIRARKLADGTVSYTAQIRIKRDGMQVYQESQTFARKQVAQAWARKRETELDEPGAIERASRKGATVKEMNAQYLVEVEKARPLGKTKRATRLTDDEKRFLTLYREMSDIDRHYILCMAEVLIATSG